MSRRKRDRDRPLDDPHGPPREISMTDLEADAEEHGMNPASGVDAAGTPGGGTDVGGLAGTNVGHGSPEDVDLDSRMGSGSRDAEDNDAP